MLAFETRASSGVGVAISVTTIPAAAYLGVAAGLGEASKALGALAVLTDERRTDGDGCRDHAQRQRALSRRQRHDAMRSDLDALALPLLGVAPAEGEQLRVRAPLDARGRDRARAPRRSPRSPARRWVISNVARSRVLANSSATIASAVAMSRCSPGSSRISTGKSASSARAIARRWRWPPDMRAPRSPSSVAHARRQPLGPVEQAGARERFTQLLAGRVAPRESQVLLERVVEDVGVLGDEPDDPPAVLAR